MTSSFQQYSKINSCRSLRNLQVPPLHSGSIIKSSNTVSLAFLVIAYPDPSLVSLTSKPNNNDTIRPEPFELFFEACKIPTPRRAVPLASLNIARTAATVPKRVKNCRCKNNPAEIARGIDARRGAKSSPKSGAETSRANRNSSNQLMSKET